MKVIRIPIPVSLHEDRDSNPCSTDSDLDFRKGLNGWSMRVIWIHIQRIRIQILKRGTLMDWFESLECDSNPWWRKKWSWESRIRITYITIQIPQEEQVKRLKHGFESPTQRFEFLNLELWRTRQGGSNLRVMDSNPFINWSWRLKVGQSDSNLRVTDSNHSLA